MTVSYHQRNWARVARLFRMDTVSASSACGQAEGKKVLVQVLSGTAPRRTIRRRLFNRGLVRKWARFLLLVWLIFFKHGAQSGGFQGLLLGAFFVPVFGPGLLTCAARIPGLQAGARNTILTAIICVRFLATSRAELWSGFMNVC